MKRFIVIGTSERVVTAVLQGIACFNDEKSVVVGEQETRKLQWSSLCSKHITLDFDTVSEADAAELINQSCPPHMESVIIPADCRGTRLINRIRPHLQARVIPYPELATLDCMDDKWQFYRLCQTHGLQVPETHYIGTKANLDFDEIVGKLGLPFVLKPTNESGSNGVQIIKNHEHYLQAVKHNDAYRFTSLIAQQYINGDDIDLSLLAIHGRIKAYAIQMVEGATIQFVQNDELRDQAFRLCSESGYHGLMHIDARIEMRTGKVYLIESNPRFWASLTAAAWCGLNFVEESACDTMEAPLPLSLVSGTAYRRHPLLRPSSWPTLFDGGYQGRLTRASIFDAYTLSQFMLDLPVVTCRYVGKYLAQGMQAVRTAPGHH